MTCSGEALTRPCKQGILALTRNGLICEYYEEAKARLAQPPIEL